MAFLYDQRQRLLREYWTAPGLAEEIFAMMSPDVPNNTAAPVQINLPTGSTVQPIQIGNYDPGAPVINFTGPGGEELGTWAPSLTPNNEIISGSGSGGGGGGGGVSPPSPSNQGKTYPGFVTEGSGNTYQVNIYKNGYPSGPTTNVTVTQLYISGDNIDAGTAVMVTGGPNGEWYMQQPVWN